MREEREKKEVKAAIICYDTCTINVSEILDKQIAADA
jgi:hypothetical protein